MDQKDLKKTLKDLGWRIENNSLADRLNEATWYAWLPNRTNLGWSNCECNNKPPTLVIKPYQINLSYPNKDIYSKSVEFTLTGEVKGNWHTLTIYGVPFDQAVEKIPFAIKQLGNAWTALFT